jgi:hypothetical protein
VGYPEGHLDSLAVLGEAVGGGVVGAVADVAFRIEEDGPRERTRTRIIGVDRRRHQDVKYLFFCE